MNDVRSKEVLESSNSPRPRILYIASRERSYSRVDLILEALQLEFPVMELVSSADSYLKRIFSVLFAWARKRYDYDVVVIGFFAQPLFPLIRLLTRKPIVSDVYFSVFDTLIQDKALFSRRHPASWLALWLDRTTCRRSNRILTDTNSHSRYIAALTGVPESRFSHVWIGAQPKIFQRLPPPEKRDGQSHFEILFYGGFIPLQGVDVIIKAASLLKGQRYNFHIVGAGQTERACRELDAEESNDNTIFHGWKTQDQVLLLARKCDLVLGIFGSSEKASRVIPNKVFEGLAMGKPILTGDSPAIRELLTPGHDVVTCKMGDPHSLANSIQWCATNQAELVRIGSNGYDTFSRRASPAALATLLKPVIAGCLPTGDH